MERGGVLRRSMSGPTPLQLQKLRGPGGDHNASAFKCLAVWERSWPGEGQKGRDRNHGDLEGFRNKHQASQVKLVWEPHAAQAAPGLGDVPEWLPGHRMFAFHAWFTMELVQPGGHCIISRKCLKLKKKKKPHTQKGKRKRNLSTRCFLYMPSALMLKPVSQGEPG